MQLIDYMKGHGYSDERCVTMDYHCYTDAAVPNTASIRAFMG